MGRFLAIGLGACLLCACGGDKTGGSGGATCEAALQHALSLYLAASGPGEAKERAKDRFHDEVSACEAGPPPQAELDCKLNAKTIGEVYACDRPPP